MSIYNKDEEQHLKQLIIFTAHTIAVDSIENREEFLETYHDCFIISDSNEYIIPAYDYEFLDEELILITTNYIDPLLEEEINNLGLFTYGFNLGQDTGINFKRFFTDKSSKTYNPYEDYIPIRLVCDLIYTITYDHYSGAKEGDVDIDVLGELEINNFVPFDEKYKINN